MAHEAFATAWGSAYNKATAAFYRDIAATAKVARDAAELLKAQLADVIDASPLLQALVELDKISLRASNAADIAGLPANIKLYRSALTKLEGRAKPLVRDIDTIVKLQVQLPAAASKVARPFKDAYPETHRQLKLLRQQILAIQAIAATQLEGAVKQGEIARIDDAKNRAMAKVPGLNNEDDAKRRAIQQEAKLRQFAMSFVTRFKSSMAKGALVIQKIKANPDVATYNAQMSAGGRDISQNLLNIENLKNHPNFRGSSLARKLRAPGDLAKDIIPFADGNWRQLPPTSTSTVVKMALDEFTKLHKRIAATYADVLTGKLD